MSYESRHPVRALAFYLPQFHPIPENDEAWGRGFTEWTNVTRAKPLFKGHYQPHLPADLGFYDLRVAETRNQQADLAREYGIHGFCYYHYWFNGRRLLERPFNEVLSSGTPDFPFCLCWANESWSRRWDGSEDQLIMRQEYSLEDDIKHMEYLCTQVFNDRRYIRVDGKPFFMVYRSPLLPDSRKTTDIWRTVAQRHGMELYLCRVESFSEKLDPQDSGFDAAVEFQPEWYGLFPRMKTGRIWNWLRTLGLSSRVYEKNYLFEYARVVDNNLRKALPKYRRFPCVTPMWDNSARKKEGGTIITGSTPELYEQWLLGTVERFKPYSPDENLIFLNAWNEWAEGNHLEPCQKWGRAYLEATRRGLAQ